MFERPRHQAIARLLAQFDGDLLLGMGAWFGGGTAIVLALDEYRESTDIGFLCATQDWYRKVRELTRGGTFDELTRPTGSILLTREARGDQYGVRARARLDEIDIKVEFIREARIALDGAMDKRLGVPLLGRADLYAEKLLANANLYADPGVLSRDIIDLAMMISRWGPIPEAAWSKAGSAYGVAVAEAYAKASELVARPAWLDRCLSGMAMSPSSASEIRAALQIG